MKEYYLTVEEAMEASHTSKQGLSVNEAQSRMEKYGSNQLSEGKKKSLLQRIIEQISDPMIIVLIAAAIISGAFQEIADMIIILIVVILNAILGIFQESKAEKAIEALQRMSAPHSKVRRDGIVYNISSNELVPGDVVLLEAGDSVPADMRLIESASLKIEEAALTGESVPAEKHTAPLESTDGDISLGDRVNMAYMGTNVVYGRAEGVVTSTGMNTEMGRIADILSGNDDDKTPLQLKLASLSKILSLAVLGICVFIFLFSILQNGGFHGGQLLNSLLTAVSLAVAAIPEGLVVVVTVLLSIGVTKMSKQSAIIRRLTAVETLGCTQIICSDKTGTLTQNRMTVVDRIGDDFLLSQAMFLCNDAQIDADGKLVGDPTETALKDYASANLTEELKNTKRVGEIPFDSVRKMMSTMHPINDGKIRQFTKGAPDEILSRCTSIWMDGNVLPLTDTLRNEMLSHNKRMADKALRVLAAAFRDHDNMPETDPENVEQDMIFIGMTGMIDPVRPEVVAAISECRSAGIRPIMITGDHKDTAVAIAKELGILESSTEAVTGAELSAMSDSEFDSRIENIRVYARVQPEDKVRIVSTWKRKGKITAMTGDGVNDAPALKSADIGVGMGITGTDVTKNVADMVLADDNFATIVYAVKEGRRIYENIRKAIQFLLSSNLSEVFAIFIATLFSWRLFAPIHILWINLITDTFPAMALGMEEAESDSMQKPPRDPRENIFASGLGMGVVYQGISIAILTLVSFFIGSRYDQLTGMTMAFLTLSLCEIFHSFNMRSRNKSIFSLHNHNIFLYGAMILSFVLTLGTIYIPGLNSAFQLTPLPFGLLVTATALALAIIPLVECVKLVNRIFRR